MPLQAISPRTRQSCISTWGRDVDGLPIALFLDALSSALILALVALGLVIVFGMMGIINMAHGEMLMLGAYTVAIASSWGAPFWLAAAVAPIAVGVLGIVIEFVLIRRLPARPLDTILATWGLAIVLRQGVVLSFGPRSLNVDAPTSADVAFAGITYPAYRLLLMVVAIVALSSTLLLFARTGRGLVARAAMARPDMAAALGIDVRRVRRWTFALGAALAGLAGALLAPLISIDPYMGTGFLVPAFLAAVVGGGTSLSAVLVGAGVIGGADSLLGHWMSPVLSQMVVFLLAVLVIRRRPGGLVRQG